MIWVYRALFPFVLLLLSPRYLLRMWRRGGYGPGFADRFGFVARLTSKKRRRIWLQAVSVGEMLAIEPILRQLNRDGHGIHLSTTTSTGYRLAEDRYLGLVEGLSYFPIDWFPFSSLAWKRIDPDLALLTEGERWPEHLRQAAIRKVPVLCINARISDRSYGRLRRMPGAARLMLGGIGRLLASSSQDAGRFESLGFPKERLAVTGNIKLDVAIAEIDAGRRSELKASLGLSEGLVIAGASTWPGEDEALIEVLRNCRQLGLACRLLLVPRHAERRHDLQRLLKAGSFSFHLRSAGPAPGPVDIAVADTTGELRTLLQLADLVFVGKSLPPHTEGQTPVEAAILGKPVVFGPGMGNFRLIAADLVDCGAARQIRKAAELGAVAAEMLGNPVARQAMAQAAAGWRVRNSGAVDRTLAIVRRELESIRPLHS